MAEDKKDIRNFEIEYVDVDLIRLDLTNPNEMPKEKMEALRKIMREKGFLQPILIDQDSLMIDGEHRFTIYREFGMKQIPCFRLDVTDVERRLLRQTMNKLRGEHNPREDVEDLLMISKQMSIQDMSSYLGVEEKNLADYLNSVNQVPESYLMLMAEDRKKVQERRFISLKLTDDQAKRILDELGEMDLKEIVLVPMGGMLSDNIGRRFRSE